jgi:hypothetical protein
MPWAALAAMEAQCGGMMAFSIMKKFALRYLVLVPIAYCLYLLLASNDVNVRLGAIIALIVLEQVRDWSLLSAARELAKGNKP